MKKDILHEVYRIQELIGIQKNIIKENKYIKFLSDIIKDFIATSTKTIPRVTDEVMVGSIQVKKRFLDDIVDILNDPQLYETLSDVEKTLFARIVSQSPEIVNDIYKKVFDEFVDSTDATEKQLINKIAREYKDGKQISQILKEMTGVDDPFIPTLLTKKIYDKVKDIATGKFVEEVKPKSKAGDDISQVIKKVAKDPKTIDSNSTENINWINKFLSSRKTVFNLVRRSANSALLRYEKKLLGNEQFIQKTFQDILQTINKINGQLKGNVTKIDDKIITELRNTASKIKVIQDTYKVDVDALYKEIEDNLYDNVTDEKTKELLPEFMKKLKEVDPFAVGSWEEKSYWLKFLNNTSTQLTINNIGRILKNVALLKKEVWGELFQLLSRVPMFLLTGVPKTLTDFQSYFVKYGDVRGFKHLVKDMWLATHIGLPLSIAVVQTIYNFLLLSFTPISGVPRETVWNDYITNLNNTFLNQYKFKNGDEPNLLSIAYGLLTPGHFIGLDVWNWFAGFSGRVERGEARPNKDIPQRLLDVFKQYKIPQTAQDSMLNVLKNASSAEEAKNMIDDFYEKNAKPVVTPIVDRITKSTSGFKAFCLATKNAEFRTSKNIDKEYTFDSWGGLSGRTKETNPLGTTNWYWNDESDIFEPY
jgi:hypothetical protein